MPNVTIDDTLIKSELEGSDFIPIWDSAAGEQKKILASTIAAGLGIAHPGHISNRWYLSAYALESPSTQTKTVSSGLIYFPLFPMYQQSIFSDIGVNVTTAGTVARVGVYKVTNGGMDLVGDVEVDVSGTGFRSSSLSLNLEPGLYAAAIFGQGSINVTAYTQKNSLSLFGSSFPTSNLQSNLASCQILTGQPYGSLPASVNPSSVDSGPLPAIWLKAV